MRRPSRRHVEADLRLELAEQRVRVDRRLDPRLQRARAARSRARSSSACAALQVDRALLGRRSSPFLTWPSVRVRSVPPPLITRDESPRRCRPCSATLSGVLEVVGDALQVALRSSSRAATSAGRTPSSPSRSRRRRSSTRRRDGPPLRLMRLTMIGGLLRRPSDSSEMKDASGEPVVFIAASRPSRSTSATAGVGQPRSRAACLFTWPSSSAKVGRSVEYSTLRPNSTAIAGA